MSDPRDFDPDEVEITTRPYFDDLGTRPAPAPAPTTPRVRGNNHLLAAATGRPPLHIVDDEEATQAGTRRDRKAARSVSQDDVLQSRGAAWIEPDGYLDVDWDVVMQLTREIPVADVDSGERDRGSFDVATASAGPETPAEERTWREIERIIDHHVNREITKLGADHDWSPLKRGHYRQAIFDQAHRYGRLQQYLREEKVEDISIVGHDNVVVTKTSGQKERRPPIAKNDRELDDLIGEIASYRGRSFARPGGRLNLDIGGARVSATGYSSVTNITVRKHGFVDISLDDMVKLRTINEDIAAFLAAASRANVCQLVAGFPAAGKTTFVRALTSEVPPEEKITTIETERELYLHKLPERHWQVQDLQYVPPQAAGADSAAGITLEQCLDDALRASTERIIFAEIKSIEGPIALKTMQAGKGSLSTIHSRSADDAIHRFADVLMSELGLSDDTVPLRQIGRSLDLILYIETIWMPNGTRRRIVTEVTEVRLNDQHQPMAKPLFLYDAATDSWTTPEEPTRELAARLHRAGYRWPHRKGLA
ncbi:ATPase, T2SS/T4P/T4SS family [Microbacterium xylanilyticum]